MDAHTPAGLERSCGDWIRIAPPVAGLERVEAYFAGHAYDPHRHDTYAIGYALGGKRRALPFVRDTVSNNRRIVAAIAPALSGLDRPLEDVQRDQVILALADALAAADTSMPPRRLSACDWRAVGRARDMLDANVAQGVASSELEAATGQTRYALARHFRACMGTSPYRYLIMRRLGHARRLIREGIGLADVAAVSGFADQSHMCRHFRRAYGLPPGRWRALSMTISAEKSKY